jgi:hypothetical protein
MEEIAFLPATILMYAAAARYANRMAGELHKFGL